MTRTLWMLMLTLIVANPSAHAQVMSRAELDTALQSTKQSLKDLVGAKKKWIPAGHAYRKDALGRTLSGELKDLFLVSDVQSKLKTQLSGAESDLAAGDLPGAQVRLNDVRTTLRTEFERYRAIMDYWLLLDTQSRYTAGPISEEANPPTVANNAIRDRWHSLGIITPHDEEVASIEAAFAKQIESRDYVTALRGTWPQLLEVRKRQSADRSQQLLSRIDRGEWAENPSTKAARACAAPSRTSDFAMPAHTLDFQLLKKKKSGLSRLGEATVVAAIDAQGCLEQAFIVKNASEKRADEHALYMVATSVWWPGQKDGVAVRGGKLISFRFEYP